MIMEPELVIADEPISALDVSIRAQVLNLMKKFQQEQDITYLFIAHDLSIVRFISDRIAVIYKGDIVEVAETDELFNFPLHPYTRSLISAIPIPDPQLEKHKALFTYDPSVHDYSTDKPALTDIGHGHFVYGNGKENEENKEPTREESAPAVREDEVTMPPIHDTGSVWYAVLSFLLPVLGIIAALVFKHFRHRRNYRQCRKGAIIGFVVIGVILALFALFLALAVV